jgi:hypothetical protein
MSIAQPDTLPIECSFETILTAEVTVFILNQAVIVIFERVFNIFPRFV